MLLFKLLWSLLSAAAVIAAGDTGVLESRYTDAEFALSADPTASQWIDVSGVSTNRNYLGEVIPGPATEFRSRWTDRNVYLLYICPYDELNLKPDPNIASETPRLWNWDVGEAFIGTDFEHIGRYKELQVSPQSEWVDLDINRDDPKWQRGSAWNSGYKVKGRIDPERRVWYGEMVIPLDALGVGTARAGVEMRVGLYRIAGAAPNRKYYAWQPTGQTTFHVPQAFGRLRLVK